eukprot:3379595-Rhodomonas_salina.1
MADPGAGAEAGLKDWPEWVTNPLPVPAANGLEYGADDLAVCSYTEDYLGLDVTREDRQFLSGQPTMMLPQDDDDGWKWTVARITQRDPMSSPEKVLQACIDIWGVADPREILLKIEIPAGAAPEAERLWEMLKEEHLRQENGQMQVEDTDGFEGANHANFEALRSGLITQDEPDPQQTLLR